MRGATRQWAVGDALPSMDAGEITRPQIDEYCRVSNDPNPMHTDEEISQSAGHPTVFAPGMLSMGLLARAVTAACGFGKLREIKVRFKTMTWPGEHITCVGTVTAVTEVDGKRLVTCDIQTQNGDGQPKVTGTATFEA